MWSIQHYRSWRLLEVFILNGISFPINFQTLLLVLPSDAMQNQSHHSGTAKFLKYSWNIGRQLLDSFLMAKTSVLSCFFMIIYIASTYSSCGTVSIPPQNLCNLLWLSLRQLIKVSLERPEINRMRLGLFLTWKRERERRGEVRGERMAGREDGRRREEREGKGREGKLRGRHNLG